MTWIYSEVWFHQVPNVFCLFSTWRCICTVSGRILLLAWGRHSTHAEVMARYRSCPAVSQICAFIVFPSTWMLLVANSTPMVLLLSRLNSLRVKRDRRLLFPTPESPINTTGRKDIIFRISSSHQHFHRAVVLPGCYAASQASPRDVQPDKCRRKLHRQHLTFHYSPLASPAPNLFVAHSCSVRQRWKQEIVRAIANSSTVPGRNHATTSN